MSMSNRLLRALNAKNNGNQSELARFIGVTPQAVQKWISGETEPRGKNLALAAEFLGLTPSQLRFGVGEPKRKKIADHSTLDEAPSPQVNETAANQNISPEDLVELVQAFSSASPKDRKMILTSAKVAADRAAARKAKTGTSD